MLYWAKADIKKIYMMTMAVMTYGIMIVIYVCSLAAASDGGHVWLIVLYQA